MAKRKDKEESVVADFTDEEYTVYLYTKLFQSINPSIDLEATFEIVCLLLEEGITIENVEYYGQMIRATSFPTSKAQH